MKPKAKTSLSILLLALMSIAICGCGGSDPIKEHVAGLNKTNIQKIANVYGLFAALKQNKGPKDKQALVDFVRNEPSIKRNLDLMGIERDKVEEYFVSPVDMEEFSVRWNVKFNPDGSAIPLVFEKTGNADGTRRVALSDGRVLDVEKESKYKDLFAGKISKADAGTEAWQGAGDVEAEQPDIQ